MVVNLLRPILLSSVIALCSCGGSESADINDSAVIPTAPLEQYSREQVMDIAVQKYLDYATSNNPAFGSPRTLEPLTGQWEQEWLNWTSGFFAGALWHLAVYEDSEALYEQARRWTLTLEEGAQWITHDIGFIIDLSYGKAGRITGDPVYDEVRGNAAQNLSQRYSPVVGAIRSWNDAGRFTVIIDNMMNLSLLFDVASAFKQPQYYTVAYEHMQTTNREFFRQNDTSYHVVEFSEATGEVIRKRTEQGANRDSTWSRGQAWAIYGFAVAAKETGNADALSRAIGAANWFIDNLPEDGVPYWDFDQQGGNNPRDTSASAIAAAGLWILSDLVSNSDDYQDASLKLIDDLLNEEYISVDPSHSYLLKQATGHYPANSEVNTSLIYADYYLIEALLFQLGTIQQPL